jgi:hypothetical protein
MEASDASMITSTSAVRRGIGTWHWIAKAPMRTLRCEAKSTPSESSARTWCGASAIDFNALAPR